MCQYVYIICSDGIRVMGDFIFFFNSLMLANSSHALLHETWQDIVNFITLFSFLALEIIPLRWFSVLSSQLTLFLLTFLGYHNYYYTFTLTFFGKSMQYLSFYVCKALRIFFQNTMTISRCEKCLTFLIKIIIFIF